MYKHWLYFKMTGGYTQPKSTNAQTQIAKEQQQ